LTGTFDEFDLELTVSDRDAPVHDVARLRVVRDLEILDVAADCALDRLTRVATRMLGVPVALVSMIDADRQYFLSQQGLPSDFERARQVPLSHSLCKHLLEMDEPLIVEDARDDELLKDSLAIRDLNVVAYAGVPLKASDGQPLGSFCAIDHEPRVWSAEDMELLADLAKVANDYLNLRGELVLMGTRDRLTGLPNRNLMLAYCDELLSEERKESDLVAVICLGLDHFNQINQAFGADEADAVLQEVATRLAEDTGEIGLFGRLRGDVFTLITSAVNDEDDVRDLADRMRAKLDRDPLTVHDSKVRLSATAGVAMSRSGSQAADLISQAANAMREAKAERLRTKIAEEGWTRKAARSIRLREALAGALQRDEISMVYQPIVDLESLQATGMEALVRWTNPDLGLVSPEDFVPLAEATADIIPISEAVLAGAVSQLSEWRRSGHADLSVTVNVSPLQLESANFAEMVEWTLRNEGLEGAALGVEITEGAFLESGPVQRRNLVNLHDFGVRIMLDDFGTGFSALNYLRHFPIDVIKIDKSFVDTMPTERTSAALVQAIIAMAKGMDLTLVAEGIETSEQCHLLRLLGCSLGQGFHFSKPLPGDQVRFSFDS